MTDGAGESAVKEPGVPGASAGTPSPEGAGAPLGPLLEDQLCLALYRASRAVIRAYGPLLSGEGLTYPQYLVMTALWQEGAPLSVTGLGARLGLDSGTLTPLLRRLEGQGRVVRRRGGADERKVLVSLTQEGRQVCGRVEQVPCAVARRYPLTEGEMVALHAQLGRITSAFEAPED